jgi:hypothetical protein
MINAGAIATAALYTLDLHPLCAVARAAEVAVLEA